MTAANFQACLAFTLKQEGGRSNDARDPGGRTMEGVTQTSYDAYRDRERIGRADVFLIGPVERDAIYRTEYWDRIKGDGLLPGEDLAMFDFAVNSGPARASDIRARVLAKPGISTGQLISAICAYRLSFLRALRTWSYFGADWGRRVAACEACSLQMASVPLKGALDRATAGKARHGATASVVAGIGAAGAAILHHARNISGFEEAAFAMIALVAVALLAFASSRHGQRADALASAIDDMRARGDALKQAEAAEAVQKTAVRAEIDKQMQQIKQAEAAEAALANAPAPPSASPSNKELKK